MASSNLLVSLFILQVLFVTPTNSKLFREYIGAGGKNVSFPDVPINPNVDFHFILSFAIDYTNTSSPSPTNGNFSAYWDKENLNPSQISSIKADHPNVKVAMSVAGDSVNGQFVYFSPVDVVQSSCHETESVNSHKYHLILDHRKENYNRKLPL